MNGHLQAATEERLRGHDEANSVVRKSRSIEDRLLFIGYRFGICPERRLLGQPPRQYSRM